MQDKTEESMLYPLLFLFIYPILMTNLIYEDNCLIIANWIIDFLSNETWGNFLPILITFYVGMLAFLIPISIQMLSTIRKDFPTEQIENRFKKEKTFKWLPSLLIFQILFVGLIEIYSKENVAHPMLLLVIIIFFLIISIMTYLHINKMIQYTDKKLVISGLIQDTKAYMYKHNDVKMSKIALRALFDILTQEINKAPNYDLIENNLNQIKDIALKFIPLEQSIDIKLNDNNFEYFKEISSGLEKITKKAIKINNNDILSDIEIFIYAIIDRIVIDKNNYHFLENLFSHQRYILYSSIDKNIPIQHAFLYHWYSHYVFNWYDKNNIFNTEYLQLFDKYQFEYIQYIIDKDNIYLFESYISWLHYGIGFQDNMYSDIYDYAGYKNEDYKLLSDLDDSFNKIRNIKQLNEFLTNFDKLRSSVVKGVKDEVDLADKIQQANEIISSAHQRFFFNSLLNMIHGISTYCLYKKKYKYIKFIWEFKDPKDSESTDISHNIYPKTVGEIINFFVKDGHSLYRKFLFREHNHHGSYYEKRFELYLLGFIIQKNNNFNVLSKYLSNEETSQSIKLLQQYIIKLKEIVPETYSSSNIKIFRQVGFERYSDKDTDKLKETIITFFDNLKKECDDLLQEKEIITLLSENKINEFKKNVVDKIIANKSKIQEITKISFGKYDVNDLTNATKEIGLNILLDRTMFIEDWMSGFIGYEDNISKGIIQGENNDILKQLVENCQEVNKNDFESILSKFQNKKDIFIILINSRNYFRNNKFFKDRHRLDVEKIKDENGTVLPSFFGYLEYQNIDIPMFSFNYNSQVEKVLILDKNRFITFIQYKSSYEDDVLKDFYYISIDELSDEKINDIVTRDIKKGQNKVEMIKNIKTKLNFRLYESFESKLDDNFEGYTFITKEI